MGDDNRNFMNNQNGQNNSGGNNGNKKDDKKNTNRVSLLISMATALIMIIGFMWVMNDMESKSTEEITYNEFIQYLEEDNRPQVTLDVDYENGMGVSVGRIREDSVYDWKFIGLSHNTVRGAAGGAVLVAELLKAQGYITAK